MVSIALAASALAQNQWSNVPIGAPPLADSQRPLVYDSSRGRVVMLCESQTWEWDGSWTRCSPTHSPAAAKNFRLAFDSARGLVVLFGGHDTSWNVLAETWEWDGSFWNHRTPSHAPPARTRAPVCFDPQRGRVVLFGGLAPSGSYLADTWEWDGNVWVERFPAHVPPARAGAAMCYDDVRQRTLLAGGDSGGPPMLDEIWEWDGNDWVAHTPAHAPAGYGDPQMEFDSGRGRAVLFLENDATAPWEWDGVDWILRTPTRRPVHREVPAYVYDARRACVLMYGGAQQVRWQPLHDVEMWDGADWVRHRPGQYRVATVDHASAYDPWRAEVVCFGGAEPRGQPWGSFPGDDTWVWDGATWTDRVPAHHPSARLAHGMARDAGSLSIVLFGGIAGTNVFGDTWAWDGTDWTERFPVTTPGARHDHAMATDETRGRVVLFGGTDAAGVALADTWEYDGVAWTLRSPPTSPPPLRGPAMLFDGARGEVLLVGRSGANETEVWAWDGVDWTRRYRGAEPSHGCDAAFVHDARRGLSYLFGGRTGKSTTCGAYRVLAWNGSGFDEVVTQGSAELDGRWGHAMEYDASRDEFVMFGGWNCGSPFFSWFSDTWTLQAGDAVFRTFGAGCDGSGGSPSLDARVHPHVASPFALQLTALPVCRLAVPFGLIGFTGPGSAGLPWDLGPIGMTGCRLYLAPAVDVTLENDFGTATWSLPIPNDTGLVQLSFFVQALVIDFDANPFGATTSNAAECVIGAAL